MTIKRYEGQYVHEVIARIREELGPEAVVLHTRWRNPAGLQRLLGRQGVEVWASEAGLAREADEAIAPEPEPAANGQANGQANGEVTGPSAARALALRQTLATLEAEPPTPEPKRTTLPSVPAAPAPDADPASREVSRIVARLEQKLDSLRERLESGGIQAAGNRCRALIEVGIDPEVAAEIVDAADESSVGEVLGRCFRAVPEWRLDQPRVVVLAGPSGAGKTSTVAKLAARFGLRGGRRVLLVSCDTQRVGTFEQIQALGELMELPVTVVRTAAEAAAKLRGVRHAFDLILIDTPAVNEDAASWRRLTDILLAVEPDEVQAVLPATLRGSDARRVLTRLTDELHVAAVVVTKLDETTAPGLLADIAWRHGLPISYLGCGPEIPADLEPARAEALLDLVWSSRLALARDH